MSDDRRVVVGVDGSKKAVSAALWAAAIAESLDSPLHIVHAEPYSGRNFSDALTAIRAADAAALRDAGPAIIEAADTAVRAEHPDLTITSALISHPIDEALIDLSHSARLIVLSSDEFSVGAAVLVGSTTVAVASHAVCPVVAWRGDVDRPTGQPIVLGVGGDDNSEVAIDEAFQLAERLAAGVVAVHAWSTRRPPGEVVFPLLLDWEAIEADERRRLADTLAPWKRRHPGVDVTSVVHQQKPSSAILQHARDAQLVVVGSRGRGTLTGALLGSTGLNLLHHSPVPTMICRAQGESA